MDDWLHLIRFINLGPSGWRVLLWSSPSVHLSTCLSLNDVDIAQAKIYLCTWFMFSILKGHAVNYAVFYDGSVTLSSAFSMGLWIFCHILAVGWLTHILTISPHTLQYLMFLIYVLHTEWTYIHHKFYPLPIQAIGYCGALRCLSVRPSVHPALATTLQSTIFNTSDSCLVQPLTLVGAWTPLIMGPLCSFCRIQWHFKISWIHWLTCFLD